MNNSETEREKAINNGYQEPRCSDCLFAEKGSCCWYDRRLESVLICGGVYFEPKPEKRQ